jgi:hypothetical protein
MCSAALQIKSITYYSTLQQKNNWSSHVWLIDSKCTTAFCIQFTWGLATHFEMQLERCGSVVRFNSTICTRQCALKCASQDLTYLHCCCAYASLRVPTPKRILCLGSWLFHMHEHDQHSTSLITWNHNNQYHPCLISVQSHRILTYHILSSILQRHPTQFLRI